MNLKGYSLFLITNNAHYHLNRLFQLFVGITCLFLLSFSSLKAQVITSPDSIKKIELPPKKHSPRKASLMSAVLPGLGQAYNKKYWKIPVMYTAFAALGYAVNFNNSRYKTYKNAFILRNDSDPLTIDPFENIYSSEDLATLKNSYHRYRDLSFIGIAALYFLNIIDANVDAHLFTFDVSDDLSFNLSPYYNYSQPVKGLTLTVKL
jgi:hypothetical protein